MYALHALWESEPSGVLHLWGETSEKPAAAKKPKGRQSKIPKPLPHPFAIEEEKLKELVSEISGSLLGESVTFDKLAIRLPSANGLPTPSPQLIRDQDEPMSAPEELQPWYVPSAIFEPGLALDFLLALPNQSTPTIALGTSIRFWAEVAKFAIELITKQSFFPVVLEEKTETKSYRAAWSVYLSEADFTRTETLAKAMPPVCRAALTGESSETPAPLKVVLHFLNQTTDHFIRQQLITSNILSRSTASRRENLPLPEAWLQALSSSDPILDVPRSEMAAFFKTLNAWLEQIRPSPSAAPFRTCFRLDPPDDGDPKAARWGISFHLQAVEDRSLMIPSEKVWASRGSTLTFLKRKFENPQERLLADLAKAARVFPAIESSLKTARPSGLVLDTPQAYQFLRETAPLLEQSGFGVLLPAWWQKPALRLGVKLNVRPQEKSGSVAGESLLGLDGIVEYNWQIALGDETLSPEEFEKLASLKVPLVKVRGQWVELKPEEIEKAIAFFKQRHGKGEMSLREALRLGLSGDISETGLKVTGFSAQGWIGDIISTLTDGVKIESLPTPTTFHGELRPYQVRGFSWLAFLKQFGLGACLADDMGLGKTIQFIALLLHERRGKLEPSVKNRSADKMSALRPTLLICPTSVVGNWHREIQRFAPSLRVMIHHGTERLSEKAFEKEAQAHDVVISTYALAHRDEATLATIRWDTLVLDEAQNIKNTATKQTQALRRLQADYRVALTGTPVENRLSELWSIMEFLNPGYLGSAHDFRGRFAVPIERYRNSERAQALKNLIQPFVLRRLKTDATIIQDLPAKNEMKVFCNLTAEQASLYEAVVKEMLEKIANSEGIERKGLVLATLMKLKQVCNHPAHFLKDGSVLEDRSGKLTRLREMLEEALSENDKALLFTQFTEMGTLLRHYLQESLGVEVLFLHGGTPKKQRDDMVQRFQEQHAGPPLFILSLKAGGVGLNLTAANQVFHFDRWWNPAVENQATDRAFRIGQKKNVQVYKFVCLGTLEERIDRMIENKKELAENVVGTGEGWLTELSTDELREVLALSREGV
ncbi:MAG: DEAD/DEAH box helicase [candidate division KSB1 bacterium]|nr:DEAD/DEAH box helicase [candidate division KSB1 bacterium]MDZ7302074.1 DEAD/DEAH box helicase [candidate division KSB1 bacterium]MDZ7311116.1 DEAD/DEAH box helicase [candidate division KSB1 bacterium]